VACGEMSSTKMLFEWFDRRPKDAWQCEITRTGRNC
jgi:hypothetical protein